MSVKFLKAGTGDAILIQHKGCNILIDGGNDFTYLKNQVTEINEAGQKIDLLFVTHHDDDHISGIILLLQMVVDGELSQDFIKKIIFNSPRKIKATIVDTLLNFLSYKQANDVEKLIEKIGLKCDMIHETSDPLNFDGIKLTFLSPAAADLKDYSEEKGAYLTGDFRCDWNSSMSALEKYIDDASIDKSLPNKTSIIILAEVDDKRFLLTGDCTPERFESALNKLMTEGETQVTFDIVKLPHHGSYRNLTKVIVEKIACARFVISTNSKMHFLPNKRALLKIIKHSTMDAGQIEFIFNYEEALNALKITEEEKRKYRIKLTRNNKPYGISI